MTNLSLQITVRGGTLPEPVKEWIGDKVDKLNLFYGRITACRVTIDLGHPHQLYDVRIHVNVPGAELVTQRQSRSTLTDPIRDAFHAIERQLENHTHLRRGEVNRHLVG